MMDKGGCRMASIFLGIRNFVCRGFLAVEDIALTRVEPCRSVKPYFPSFSTFTLI